MFSLKITTRCHSVFSLRSPDCLSRQLSDVATERFTTGSPMLSFLISGSLPRLPIKITVLTLPAMTASVFNAHKPNRLRSPKTPRPLPASTQTCPLDRAELCSYYVLTNQVCLQG